MKRVLYKSVIVAMLFYLVLSMCSCSSVKKEDDLFDASVSHLPTEDDMKKVKQGMTFDEVVSIIGKPHGYAPDVNHNFGLLWNTREGTQYSIIFLLYEKPENKIESSIDYFKHSVAGIPVLVNHNTD